jgi:Tetratricopeptide repeat
MGQLNSNRTGWIARYSDSRLQIKTRPCRDGGVGTLIRGARFAAAVDLAQRVVQQNKSWLGSQHPLTISSMLDLGGAIHGDGRIEEALQVFQELLPLSERGTWTLRL